MKTRLAFGLAGQLPKTLLFAALLAQPETLSACGPFFPNNLLAGGDEPVLAAPEGNFSRALARLNLTSSRLAAINPEKGDYIQQTVDAESTDLRAALEAAKVPRDEVEQILAAHQAQRTKLRDYVAGAGARQTGDESNETDASAPGQSIMPFPQIESVPGLPGEFADYLEGAVLWHNPAIGAKLLARQAWEKLLARPPEERRYKSTWAAFMLGKSWVEEDPEKAIAFYRQVRELKRTGFVDSAGLAVASLGLEAQVYYQQQRYALAIDLYLDQLATGDPSATNSLRFAAAAALDSHPHTLQRLAANPRTRRVMTAYVISMGTRNSGQTAPGLNDPSEAPTSGTETDTAPEDGRLRWLRAVESAGVKDVESAEELALAAYQANQMESAQRWIKRAPNSPVAQWMQAKLWLRAGKVQAAANMLARITPYFPIQPHGTNEAPPVALKDTLFMAADDSDARSVPVERQVLGELGVVRLARREFTQALDALLNAGFWMDAAYVAERVLTVDELKAYVDGVSPAVSPQQIEEEAEKFGDDPASPARIREQIRYLLARRLTRSLRGEEAREYYPAEWLGPYDSLVQALNAGWNEALPASQRAKALFQAAVITRTNGMELIGTEVEPDWHIHLGDFEEGVTIAERASTNDSARILVASAEELSRAAQHAADPNLRFHYRYQAAALAWEAAKLMPNNSDETAYVLWSGGTWLKTRDPHTADLFYKALVWRNRHTALGAEADRRRWFPQLDENGNIIPRRAKPVEASESAEATPGSESIAGSRIGVEPMAASADGSDDMIPAGDGDLGVEPTMGEEQDSDGAPVQSGFEYILQKGDSLAAILRTLAEADVTITLQDLLDANPGLDPAKMKVGQKIFIPIPQQ